MSETVLVLSTENLPVIYILLVISLLSLVFSVLLWNVVGNKADRRADLYLIRIFGICNMVSAGGLFFTNVHRLQLSKMEPFTVTPVACLMTRPYAFPYIIGSDMLWLIMLLLAVERFFVFSKRNLYRMFFSVERTKLLAFFCFTASCLEATFCYLVAFAKQDEQISPACYRSQFTTITYYRVFMISSVMVAVLTMIFYLLSYITYRLKIGQMYASNSLGRMRYAREKSILRSLLIIGCVTFLMRFIPTLVYVFRESLFLFRHPFHIVENLYMVVTPLLYMFIHPLLNDAMQNCLSRCSSNCCRKNAISVVYIGRRIDSC